MKVWLLYLFWLVQLTIANCITHAKPLCAFKCSIISYGLICKRDAVSPDSSFPILHEQGM